MTPDQILLKIRFLINKISNKKYRIFKLFEWPANKLFMIENAKECIMFQNVIYRHFDVMIQRKNINIFNLIFLSTTHL